MDKPRKTPPPTPFERSLSSQHNPQQVPTVSNPNPNQSKGKRALDFTLYKVLAPAGKGIGSFLGFLLGKAGEGIASFGQDLSTVTKADFWREHPEIKSGEAYMALAGFTTGAGLLAGAASGLLPYVSDFVNNGDSSHIFYFSSIVLQKHAMILLAASVPTTTLELRRRGKLAADPDRYRIACGVKDGRILELENILRDYDLDADNKRQIFEQYKTASKDARATLHAQVTDRDKAIEALEYRVQTLEGEYYPGLSIHVPLHLRKLADLGLLQVWYDFDDLRLEGATWPMNATQAKAMEPAMEEFKEGFSVKTASRDPIYHGDLELKDFAYDPDTGETKFTFCSVGSQYERHINCKDTHNFMMGLYPMGKEHVVSYLFIQDPDDSAEDLYLLPGKKGDL